MQRRISWVGSSLKDFQKFPVAVQDQITFALRLAVNGEKADSAKSMKGLGAGMFEVALRYRTNAYRAVYAVLLGDDLYVLHTFQKKAKSGIKTPKQGHRSGEGADQASEELAHMTEEKLEIIKGTSNVFRDVGLPDPDTKLVKADLATAIVRAQREQGLTNAAAARRAGVQEADISRIRNADLNRFSIDRLVRIAQSLDPQVHVIIARKAASRTGGG